MERDIPALDLEVALERAFAAAMPEDRRAYVDRRVVTALANVHRRPSRRLFGVDRRPPLRRLLLAGAIFVALAAATVTAAGSLFGSLTAEAPLLRDVWERATPIGRSATDAGHTITLERAAVDRDRIWIAVSVTGNTGESAAPGRMHLVDAKGTTFTGRTGAGDAMAGTSAEIFGFGVPPGAEPAGPYTLIVTSVTPISGERERLGRWVIDFDVPAR